MVLLGLVFLGLVVLAYSGIDLDAAERGAVNRGLAIVYAAFVLDFALRWSAAPTKIDFLRRNWLLLVSLIVPAVRPLHATGALWGLHSVGLLRALTGINNGLRALRRVTRGRQFAYLLALSVLVVLLGAGSVLYFDREARGADIRSFGEALWWAATLITTINSADDPVSFEGRVIAVLLRVYAVSVFGYLTASIATYLIGSAGPPAAETTVTTGAEGTEPAATDLPSQVAALRHDLARLRRELGAGSERSEGSGPAGS